MDDSFTLVNNRVVLPVKIDVARGGLKVIRFCREVEANSYPGLQLMDVEVTL
jgi:hypothetical protein